MPLFILCLFVNFFSSAQEQLELFPDVVQSEKIMSELATEMGEYFDESFVLNQQYALQAVPTSQLPANLAAKVDRAIEDRNYELDPQGEVYDHTVYKVVNKDTNTTVGYVIALFDSIDDSLWDGSGVTLYLTPELVVVDSVEWSG
jgi:hypothetical protein